ENTGGRELYVSDGTLAGTNRVKDIRPGILDSAPVRFAAVNNTLYFIADNGTNGTEWWTSDGTDTGTQMLLDALPGSGNGANTTIHRALGSGRRAWFLSALVGSASTTNLLTHVAGSASAPAVVDVDFSGMGGVHGMLPAAGRMFLEANVFSGADAVGRELYAVNTLTYAGPTWCEAPEQPIADNTTTVSTFHLPPGSGTLTDVNLGIDIGHTFLGDLRITLRHEETGTQAVLFDRPGAPLGSCNGDLVDVVLDDSAATPIGTTCANARLAYTRDGSYRPTAPLTAFNGESLGGTWTLAIQDLIGGDEGTLHEWCLIGAVQPTVDLIFANSFE
ncbi:MAG: proprotein convertase P-domain-containing protein, partial [Lysobacterales bacterium]